MSKLCSLLVSSNNKFWGLLDLFIIRLTFYLAFSFPSFLFSWFALLSFGVRSLAPHFSLSTITGISGLCVPMYYLKCLPQDFISCVFNAHHFKIFSSFYYLLLNIYWYVGSLGGNVEDLCLYCQIFKNFFAIKHAVGNFLKYDFWVAIWPPFISMLCVLVKNMYYLTVTYIGSSLFSLFFILISLFFF